MKQHEIKVSVGNQILFVSLPDEPHGPLLLTVEPYQDQASGCPVTELDGKVTWVGTLQLDIPEVQFFICTFLGVPHG